MNPERDMRCPELRYIGGDGPNGVPQGPGDFKTRSALIATRRGCLIQDNEANRARGEEENLTPRVVDSIRAASVWNMNKTTFKKGTKIGEGEDGQGETVSRNIQRRTRSSLEYDRKRERKEYDMHHFGQPETQYPRYSDQTIPFWHLEQQNIPGKVDDTMRMQGLKGLYNVNSETYPQHAYVDENTGQVMMHNQVLLHHLPKVCPDHNKAEKSHHPEGITIMT